MLIFQGVITNIWKNPILVNWFLNRNQTDFNFYLIHPLFISTFLLTTERSVETVRLCCTPVRLLFLGCPVGIMTPLACRNTPAPAAALCPLLKPCSASCSSVLIVLMRNAQWLVGVPHYLHLLSETKLSVFPLPSPRKPIIFLVSVSFFLKLTRAGIVFLWVFL